MTCTNMQQANLPAFCPHFNAERRIVNRPRFLARTQSEPENVSLSPAQDGILFETV